MSDRARQASAAQGVIVWMEGEGSTPKKQGEHPADLCIWHSTPDSNLRLSRR